MIHMKKLLLFGTVCAMMACRQGNYRENNDPLHPYDLRCEYLKNPLGLDATSPRFQWKLSSAQRAQEQTAYQILVASHPDTLKADRGDLWNSGKVISNENIHIQYAGKTLLSGQQCYWKVKVWDKNQQESGWSEMAYFSMGLLQPSDWKAMWIGLDRAMGTDNPAAEKTKLSARYLRKEFTLEKNIRRATVYMCGLGLSELYINGKKISDEVLSPPLSEYAKRAYYVTYDVTSSLSTGKNAMGVILGNGRYFKMRFKEPFVMQGYGFPKLILQMVVEYTDGSTALIVSDPSWKITAGGPIVYNNEYDGEYYDARKEMKGWNEAGFDDHGWLNAEKVKPASPVLCARNIPPIRITQTLKPVKIIRKPASFIYDMGQNMVGWVKLKVSKAPAGTEIKLRFAETLTADSNLYTANLRTAECTDTYITRGDETEEWMPRFTYHGFRFVELTGYPGTPDLNTIEGMVVHDDLETNGHFECSNALINQIYKNCVWGIRGNYRSMPTDCPQRDERMGWLGDRAAGSKGESFIFDIAAFYSKWLRDIQDAQKETGSIPDVAPTYWQIYNDNVTWAGTYIILTDMLYRQYGDREIIRQHYETMKKWYVYMKSRYIKNNLLTKDTYGDWCTPPESLTLIHSKDPKRITSGILISTTYFYHISNILHRFAGLMNQKDDSVMFNTTAALLLKGLNEQLLDKTKPAYGNNSLTSNLLPMAFRMVPKELEQKIFDNILYKIMSEANGHISCGLVGCQWINRVLSDYGRPDVAYLLASNTTYPGWGYMVSQGATTIWELWNGNTADPAMNSGNHVMLIGDLVIWLYEYLGAIQSDIEQPGFKHIVMKPTRINNLTWVNASHTSLYGPIKSAWKEENSKFIWDVSIPANTWATIYIPARSEKDITEGGQKALSAPGLKFTGMKDNYAIFEAGSGDYHFVSASVPPVPAHKQYVSSPVITPSDTIATLPATIKVSISCATEGARIRYTLDGSEPSQNSTLYTSPFNITSYCIVTAKAFKEGCMESQSTNCQYDLYDPRSNAWNYAYYEGKWQKLPDFTRLTPRKKGETTSINVSRLKMREDNFGLVFTGKINLPADGNYTFSLNSDDGSRLLIDGKTVVENDSIHGMTEVQSSLSLSKGMHDIRIEYFDALFNEGLFINIQGPGIPRQRLPLAMIFKQ